MTETKTYRGKTLDEVLPQIRAELGDDAIILRRREGIVGGIGGFFGRRCVEVDAIASPVAAAPTVALPASTVFDAYDAGNETADDDVSNPVIRTMMDQAHPFAQALQAAELRVETVAADDEPADDEAAQEFQPIGFPPIAGDGDWEAAASQAVAAGLPSAVVESLVRDARRAMQPFAQDTDPSGPARARARTSDQGRARLADEAPHDRARRRCRRRQDAHRREALPRLRHRLDARRPDAQPRAARRRLPAGRADRAPRHRPAGRADARDGGPRRRPACPARA